MKSNSAHEPSSRKRLSMPWEEAPAVSGLSYRVEAGWALLTFFAGVLAVLRITNPRNSRLPIGATPRCGSADWQSAVSPVGNRRIVRRSSNSTRPMRYSGLQNPTFLIAACKKVRCAQAPSVMELYAPER